MMIKIRSSEITPEHIYLSRRKFMRGMGLVTANALLTACGIKPTTAPEMTATPTASPTSDAEMGAATSTTAPPTTVPRAPSFPPLSAETDELGDAFTTFSAITNYTNFYEFSLQKEDVADFTEYFIASPWTLQVGGLVNKPRRFDLDDLYAFEQEERIYRMRCVEAWSMVIPWLGFPLSKLLEAVEPTSEAKYVRFETLYDTEQMPNQRFESFPWPYTEGLRLDEAMHDLTILSTGLYGKKLLPQNGAPIRLVVPWKYGFKSIKSIVKVGLVAEMPTSLWMASGPSEYGFWANVNPEVPHPRWSQATERRIGEGKRRETLFFNGYAEEVAELYPDLDDKDWYY